MGLVTTIGKLRILKCDGFGCSKKVESNIEGRVQNVALWCDWKNKGDRWICPECVKKEEDQRKLPKSKRPTRRPESTL